MSPGYGTQHIDYLATWLTLEDDGPMWALNLMKYKERADYGDDRDGEGISGAEADDRYAPVDELAAVGAEIVLVAPVEHQLVGDDTTWDRVAIALYPTRKAMMEMSQRDDFQRQHEHKEAGMDCTIVLATFPPAEPAPPAVSAVGQRLLLQVVADRDAPDVAADLDATRIACFDVEGTIIGDDRTSWAEARWDVISEATAAELAADGTVEDDPDRYVVVLRPDIDRLAETVLARRPS